MIFVIIILLILATIPSIEIGGGSSQSTEKYEIDWAAMNRDAALYGERYVKQQESNGKYKKYKK